MILLEQLKNMLHSRILVMNNNIDTRNWQFFKYKDIFDIKKGKRLTKSEFTIGTTPFIGSIDSNNGYRDFIGESPNHTGNTITVNYNGSVGKAFYQPRAFWACDDVNVLYPKFYFNKYIGLFLVSLIQKEAFRFNYGRKWETNRMKESLIKLPVKSDGQPDFEFMENHIKSLPYSLMIEDSTISNIKSILKIENSQNIKPITPDIKLVPIKDLFTIKYGNSLELVRLDKCKKTDPNAINFVSRTEKNNGVSAIVEKIISENPNPAHTLSVAGGGSVLATFYQSEEYYSGRDIYCLIPKKEYSQLEMLYYAMCIRKNKYRYSYGRQANKTLKDILIPEKMPDEFKAIDIEKLQNLVLDISS